MTDDAVVERVARVDHTEWMARRITDLELALGWFLGDSRYRVAVGGNPLAVEAMLSAARRILETKQEYPL
jgi:hypothetical protein